jgi:hypothetical protein
MLEDANHSSDRLSWRSVYNVPSKGHICRCVGWGRNEMNYSTIQQMQIELTVFDWSQNSSITLQERGSRLSHENVNDELG